MFSALLRLAGTALRGGGNGDGDGEAIWGAEEGAPKEQGGGGGGKLGRSSDLRPDRLAGTALRVWGLVPNGQGRRGKMGSKNTFMTA